MITGRWGKRSEVLLDVVLGPDGVVRGVANPGRQDAPIRHGHFDAGTGAVHLEGEHRLPDGATIPFRIDGRLDGRTLRLQYHFGDMRGNVELVRVEEYRPPALTLVDRLNSRVVDLQRWFNGLSRPSAPTQIPVCARLGAKLLSSDSNPAGGCCDAADYRLWR